MILIDQLSYSSRLRYKSPRLKMLFSVATLLICVLSRSFVVSGLVLLLTGGLIVLRNGTPLGRYMRLMRIPVAFIALSTVAIVVNLADAPLSWAAVPIFGKYLTVSPQGLLFGGHLILAALAAVSCLYFLTLSTTITDILAALKSLGCPGLLIELMLLIYRFIFVLLEIASALAVAQKSRLGNRDFKSSCKSASSLMAVLLVRAFQKSSRLYDAMESRCYDGTIRVLQETRPAARGELCLVAGVELALASLALWIHLAEIGL